MTIEIEYLILIGGGALGIGGLLSALYYFARFGLQKYEEPPNAAALQADQAVEKLTDLHRVPNLTPVEQPKSLHQALSPTRNHFFGRIERLFSPDKALKAEQVREGLEEVLYTSDLGPKTVEALMQTLENRLSLTDLADFPKVKEEIRRTLNQTLDQVEQTGHSPFETVKPGQGLKVWMVVGVNGVGKTTTIGKLAYKAAAQGLKVMVAAGDTFRAAAQNQLKVWTDRAAAARTSSSDQPMVEIFSPAGVTDPAAVAFDACASAKAKGFDLVIIDTAGRLHTQANLMEELKKVKRVLTKIIPQGTDETLIVLDANSGQNALIQAKQFHEAVGLTGAVVTKMDGTAKGGVIVGLSEELKLPVRMIGIGEGVEDLREFHKQEFVDAIF